MFTYQKHTLVFDPVGVIIDGPAANLSIVARRVKVVTVVVTGPEVYMDDVVLGYMPDDRFLHIVSKDLARAKGISTHPHRVEQIDERGHRIARAFGRRFGRFTYEVGVWRRHHEFSSSNPLDLKLVVPLDVGVHLPGGRPVMFGCK